MTEGVDANLFEAELAESLVGLQPDLQLEERIASHLQDLLAAWADATGATPGLDVAVGDAALILQRTLLESFEVLLSPAWLDYALLDPNQVVALDLVHSYVREESTQYALAELYRLFQTEGALVHLALVIDETSQHSRVTAASLRLEDPVGFELAAAALIPDGSDLFGFLGGIFGIIVGGAVLLTCLATVCGPGALAISLVAGAAGIISGAFFTIQSVKAGGTLRCQGKASIDGQQPSNGFANKSFLMSVAGSVSCNRSMPGGTYQVLHLDGDNGFTNRTLEFVRTECGGITICNTGFTKSATLNGNFAECFSSRLTFFIGQDYWTVVSGRALCYAP